MKSNLSMGQWTDISIPLKPGILNWPGDPVFEMKKIAAIENADEMNITTFSTCAHIGTHVDAPLHFIKNGNDVIGIPFDNLLGEVKIIRILNSTSITKKDLFEYDINAGDRIIFKTKNSEQEWWNKSFNPGYIALSTDAAEFLADKKVKLTGIDYLSIAGMKNSTEVHTILLLAGITILEGLNLSGIEPGNYEMICLPLKIEGADGAPARVLIRQPIIHNDR